jgi:hypothetical protein
MMDAHYTAAGAGDDKFSPSMGLLNYQWSDSLLQAELQELELVRRPIPPFSSHMLPLFTCRPRHCPELGMSLHLLQPTGALCREKCDFTRLLVLACPSSWAQAWLDAPGSQHLHVQPHGPSYATGECMSDAKLAAAAVQASGRAAAAAQPPAGAPGGLDGIFGGEGGEPLKESANEEDRRKRSRAAIEQASLESFLKARRSQFRGNMLPCQGTNEEMRSTPPRPLPDALHARVVA